MKLQSRHKSDPQGSLFSMVDVVFLLLIFFILTSSNITPSGVPVSRPTAEASVIEMQKVGVTITADKRYYVMDQEVAFEALGPAIQKHLSATDPNLNVVVVHADKDLSYQTVMDVVGIAAQMNTKVSLATDPK